MTTDHEVVRAFVGRVPAPDHPTLGVEGEALTVDRWWPAALWLGPSTCLVRLDDGPQPALAGSLASVLAEVGLSPVDGDPAAIEAITVQQLGLMGATWQVWAPDDATARAAIGFGAAG